MENLEGVDSDLKLGVGVKFDVINWLFLPFKSCANEKDL